MPYTPDQMFKMVSNIERYPEFIPWVQSIRIRNRVCEAASEVIDADMVVAFKVFRERFGSRVVLKPNENRIDVSYLDGPFKYLSNQWDFEEAEGGTIVKFFVEFEFKNFILQKTMGLVFSEAMERVVSAYETRAQQLYGKGTS